MTDEHLEKCPACNSPLGPAVSASSSDIFTVPCDVCGSYDITLEAVMDLAENPEFKGKGHLLSGVLRGAHDSGRRLRIYTLDLADLIASANVPRDPVEAIDRILSYVRDRQVSAAAHVKLKENDYSIVLWSWS